MNRFSQEHPQNVDLPLEGRGGVILVPADTDTAAVDGLRPRT